MSGRGRARARLLAITAVVVMGVGACGDDGYQYVQNDDAGLYFRVPDSWAVVEVEAVDDGMPAAFDEPADPWVRLLDRSARPSTDNLEAEVPTAPVGVASVVPLTDPAMRDGLDYASLRALALDEREDPLAVGLRGGPDHRDREPRGRHHRRGPAG